MSTVKDRKLEVSDRYVERVPGLADALLGTAVETG
jgi:hypothetical protein